MAEGKEGTYAPPPEASTMHEMGFKGLIEIADITKTRP